MKKAFNKVVMFGATSGIAQEVARLLAAKSASFVLVGRDDAKLKIVADDLRTRGALAAHCMSGDFSSSQFHEEVLSFAIKELGEIDLAFLAQGSLPNQKRVETDLALARDVIEINFTAVAILCLKLAVYFENRKDGVIAVISSIAGDRGRFSNYMYGSAKAGLTAFLSGLRARLSHSNVRVVTIKPGFVATPMTAHLRNGPLVASASTVARSIVRAMNHKDEFYVPWFWYFIMLIIKTIPERIFKRLTL